MTCATATFPNVTAFDSRALALGDYRRAFRGLVIGVGAVTVAGLMAGTATVTAAWLVSSSLSTNADLHARAPRRLDMLALAPPDREPAERVAASGSRTLNRSSHAQNLTVEAELAPAAASTSAPTNTPLPRPRTPERANSAPMRPSRPFDAARIQAKLDAAGPPVEQTGSLPAPSFDPAQIQAKLDADRRAAEPAAPQVASLIAPPPAGASLDSFQKGAIPNQAHNDSMLPGPNSRMHETPRPPAAPAAPQAAAIAPASTSLNSLQKRASLETGDEPISLPGPDSHTAVYDIEAHTVYLPSGDRLEAHSGLGRMLDDPHYVNAKARGATPPNVYDLTLRGELFHGVRAIRLNPVSDSKMFGRDGILAHTYMLGPSGQSFGCVSFKNYPEFLHAFLRGEINRLVVVAHLGSRPAMAARTRRGPSESYAFNNR
jgi:hypothetical protein